MAYTGPGATIGQILESDGISTLPIFVTGTTIPQNIPGIANIGMNYASGIFTVYGANGANWSASNIGSITIPGQSASGLSQTYSFNGTTYSSVANYSFQDVVGTNTLSTNYWGATQTKAWNQDCPFYLYAIGSSSDIALGISRIPNLVQTPTVGTIAISGGSINATTQGSMFLLTKNITGGGTIIPTAATFASQPCILIGCFRMQATTGSSVLSWTVQALSNNDGIGKNFAGYEFSFPPTQNGATSQGLSSATGGDTIPVFHFNGLTYSLNPVGYCDYTWSTDFCSVNGVGTGNLQLALPLSFSASIGTTGIMGYGNLMTAGLAYTPMSVYFDNTVSVKFPKSIYQSSAGAGPLNSVAITTVTAGGPFCLHVNYLINMS